LPLVRAVRRPGRVAGVVIHVDRFGNLVTSIGAEDVATLGEGFDVRMRGRAVPVVETYGDLRAGRLGALVGSHGRLEVAVRDGSAAARLGARRGTPLVATPRRPATTRSRATRS
jgi:hypothetical protein